MPRGAQNGMKLLAANGLREKTVVIADGDVMTRSLLRSALRTVGMDVLDEARDGNEALQKIERHRPNIICLDIEMPRLSGLQVLARIRQQDQSVVVLVVSALASADNVKEAIKAGADWFVGKPFNTAGIKAAIERALERRAAAGSQLTIRPAARFADIPSDSRHRSPNRSAELSAERK